MKTTICYNFENVELGRKYGTIDFTEELKNLIKQEVKSKYCVNCLHNDNCKLEHNSDTSEEYNSKTKMKQIILNCWKKIPTPLDRLVERINNE